MFCSITLLQLMDASQHLWCPNGHWYHRDGFCPVGFCPGVVSLPFSQSWEIHAAKRVKLEYLGFCLQAGSSVPFASCTKCHGRRDGFDLCVLWGWLSLQGWKTSVTSSAGCGSTRGRLFHGWPRAGQSQGFAYRKRAAQGGLDFSKQNNIQKYSRGSNEQPNANGCTFCSIYVLMLSTNLNHNILIFSSQKCVLGKQKASHLSANK